MAENKLNFISWAKCVAILLVCIGHFLPAGNAFKVVIYTFHVPVFFLISGFLFREGERKPRFDKYLWGRVKRLGIPYALYFIISLVWYNLRYDVTASSPLAYLKVFLFHDGTTIWNYALWFVPTLFIVSIAFYFLVTKRHAWIPVAVFTFVCFAVTIWLQKTGHSIERFGLDKALHMGGYMGVGFLARRLYNLRGGTRTLRSSLCVSLTSLLIFLMFCTIAHQAFGTDRISILFCDYNDILRFVPLALIGSLSFLFMLEALPRLWLVDTIAANTLFIMGLHYIFLNLWQTEVLPTAENALAGRWLGGILCCVFFILLVSAYRHICNRLRDARFRAAGRPIAAIGECLGLFDTP